MNPSGDKSVIVTKNLSTGQHAEDLSTLLEIFQPTALKFVQDQLSASVAQRIELSPYEGSVASSNLAGRTRVPLVSAQGHPLFPGINADKDQHARLPKLFYSDEMKRLVASGSAMGLMAALLTGVTFNSVATAAPTIADKQDFTYLYDDEQDDTVALEQSWKAKQTGVAKVIAVGGGGSGATGASTSRGGNGAVVISWHSVTKDEEWIVRVGGGTRVQNPSTATGGSATAIVKQNGDPISIAGGGGGAAFGDAAGGNGGFFASGAGGHGQEGERINSNGKGGERATAEFPDNDRGGMGGDPDGGAGGTQLDPNGEDVVEYSDSSPGAGGGAVGGNGGNANGSDLDTTGGAIEYFGRTNARNGGGGAGFGGGGAAVDYFSQGGIAYQGGSGGGGFTGGGAGGHDKVETAGGGGAGSSFATTDNLPVNHPNPAFSPGPLTDNGNAYGEGGISSDNQSAYRGKDGFVRIELYVDVPPTPPTPPAPVVKTPGKPGAFKVTKKTTAKKRKFTWKASSHATKATVYTLEIRAKGKHKVLLRKRIKATNKRAVIYTRKQLIRKSRKYQKRAKTVKLQASIYAKTGSKKSTTAKRNFNVRR